MSIHSFIHPFMNFENEAGDVELSIGFGVFYVGHISADNLVPAASTPWTANERRGVGRLSKNSSWSLHSIGSFCSCCRTVNKFSVEGTERSTVLSRWLIEPSDLWLGMLLVLARLDVSRGTQMVYSVLRTENRIPPRSFETGRAASMGATSLSCQSELHLSFNLWCDLMMETEAKGTRLLL